MCSIDDAPSAFLGTNLDQLLPGHENSGSRHDAVHDTNYLGRGGSLGGLRRMLMAIAFQVLPDGLQMGTEGLSDLRVCAWETEWKGC